MDATVGDRTPEFATDYVPGSSLRLARVCWTREHLGAGLAELARRAGLNPGDLATAWPVIDDRTNTGPWLEWAAGRLGIEVEPVKFDAATLNRDIARACPAILALHDGREAVFLLMLGAGRGSLRLIGPDHAIHRCPVTSIAAVARARLEETLTDQIDQLLAAAHVRPGRRERVRTALLNERLAADHVSGCWLLRPSANAPFWFQLRHAGLLRRLGWIVALLVGLYGLEIGGWAVIGGAVLGGRLDLPWLAAWLLLVVSNVPLLLSMRWLNATFALDLGRILKRRLLAGALRMDIDAVRHQGVGQLLGRVMEAQALEGLV